LQLADSAVVNYRLAEKDKVTLIAPQLAEVQGSFQGLLEGITPIAIGGQAAVYRATRIHNLNRVATGDSVALKIYLDAQQEKRADREIQIATLMSSDCFCSLLHHGTVELNGKEHQAG
jgi:hypothetical protein